MKTAHLLLVFTICLPGYLKAIIEIDASHHAILNNRIEQRDIILPPMPESEPTTRKLSQMTPEERDIVHQEIIDDFSKQILKNVPPEKQGGPSLTAIILTLLMVILTCLLATHLRKNAKD